MGILLSNVSNTSLHYKMEEAAPTESAVAYMVEEYKGMSEEYNTIILEYLKANLVAAKSPNSISIALESLSDTASAIRQWFIKWLNKFRKFTRDCLHKLINRCDKGEAIVKKYLRELPDFEPFEVQSYKYTIAPSELEINEIQTVMSNVREGYLRIMRSGRQELNPVVASERAKISGPQILDEVRGKLVRQPAMSNEDFRSALRSSFRNNMPIKQKITIDRSKLVAMSREFMEFRKLINGIKSNRDTLESITNDIIIFIDKQPNAIKEYYAQSYSFSDTSLPKPPKGLSGFSRRRTDFDELMTMKTTALSMYFASANTTLKQIQILYDYFFAAKIDAIMEALAFYSYCIERAFAKKRG